jgi:phosphate transport system ATP-binding protein
VIETQKEDNKLGLSAMFAERGTTEEPVIGRVASRLTVQNISAYYSNFRAVRDVSIEVTSNRIAAIIGPSGCGKSTLIRTLNRMHEVVPHARVEGKIMLDGQDMYAPGVNPVELRRRVGMVFQRPNPFPTMSIFDNVAAGLKLNRILSTRHQFEEQVEKSLRQAALWDEVKDKLKEPATNLSGGQQQRLCIARALACSALDPVATLRIEELMRQLVSDYTIVIVTHNMQQAARVSDWTAVMMMGEDRAGELVEFGPTKDIFTNPHDKRTEDYITGRFG